MNPYCGMEVIIADDPPALLALIKAQRTPIKIVAIVAYGNRHAAYIMGDIRRVSVLKTKTKIKGV